MSLPYHAQMSIDKHAMKISQFGRKFSAGTGIFDLMEDLGSALNVNPDLLFLGGGNPARVPTFEREVAKHLQAIANNPDHVHKLIGVYQSPKGSEGCVAALVKYINRQSGWSIKESQLAITNGSQSAFFILINLLAGKTLDQGSSKKIVFPMMPEYLGYSDQASEDNVFRSYRPKIHNTGEQRFKYHVDFTRLTLDSGDAALCVSRPTNPTGNILSGDEILKLSQLAKENDVPFIIDCAYGDPFPGIIYKREPLVFDENAIYVLSISKLGLPGARTGIVIAKENVIDRIVKINTVMSLANGNFGPAILTSMIEKGNLSTMCCDTLLPFYRSRRDFAVASVEKYFSDIPYKLHEPEGAFFLWLWLPELPLTSTRLYEVMKDKGVLIMDGSHFFFGVDKPWEHTVQCIRLTYCQSEKVIDQAVKLLAEEIKLLC